MVQRDLAIQCNVVEVNKATKRKPASINIEFSYPSYLGAATKLADRLVEGLITEAISDKLPIRALKLTWDEYPDDYRDGFLKPEE